MAEPIMTGATAVAGSLTIAASQKVVEKVVEDLYALSTDGIREQVKRWRAKARIKHLSKKLVSVRYVKTIWQTEKEVDLMSFYYPARLLIENERKEVRSLRELTDGGNTLIEGTVGQGKSIFLRWLCVQELYRGEVVPLFVELRRLESGTKLIELLLESLDALGVGNDNTVFNFLAGSGKLIICLDGFDEVKASNRDKLIRQIEALDAKYDNLRFVVTSRPDNAIDKSTCMRVRRLAPLEWKDVRGIIDKLEGDARFTEELLTALGKRHSSITELLTTPLMVTLLVIAYKSEQQIPETTADFYDTLFNTLLLRHDKLKAGFRRERRSSLNDHSMRIMFDAMCFLCRKQQITTVEHDTLYQVCEQARKLVQVDCDPQKFMDDIKQITCLLLEEGGKYHFVHKSVSEFHAASYVRRSPDASAARFYAHVLGGKYVNWQQELEFLSHVDRYRFSKLFLIPDLVKLMKNESALENSEAWFERLVELISAYRVGFNRNHMLRSLRFAGGKGPGSWFFDTQVVNAVIDAVVGGSWDEAERKLGEDVTAVGASASADSVITREVAIGELVRSSVVQPRGSLLLVCRKLATMGSELYKGAKTFVAGTEAAAAALDDF